MNLDSLNSFSIKVVLNWSKKIKFIRKRFWSLMRQRRRSNLRLFRMRNIKKKMKCSENNSQNTLEDNKTTKKNLIKHFKTVCMKLTRVMLNIRINWRTNGRNLRKRSFLRLKWRIKDLQNKTNNFNSKKAKHLTANNNLKMSSNKMSSSKKRFFNWRTKTKNLLI